MTASTAAEQPARRMITTYLFKTLVAALIFLAIYLLAAGRWDWWPAWIYTGIMAAFSVVSAIVSDPALLAERTVRHADAKEWDTLLVALAAAFLPLLAGIVAGLDERF